jgi:hypothetical protein
MPTRIRFRLATLLWIVALLAVSLGWWIDRHRLETRHRRAQSALSHKLLMVTRQHDIESRQYAIERDTILAQLDRLSEAAAK